jgi:hypothetical protein
MKRLILLALLSGALVSHAGPREQEFCRYGVMLAQKAYLVGTFDAQRPASDAEYAYLVDYWGDMMIVPADRKVALRAVKRYVVKVKAMGIRRPNSAYLFEPTNAILYEECAKL